MKKGLIFDIVFIAILGILLVVLTLSGESELPVKFLFLPLLAMYYIGRYVSMLAYKRKD